MSSSSSFPLPSGVYNSYRTYKLSTQIVIHWVVTTSASLPGVQSKVNQTPPTPRKSGKKGRSKAKAQPPKSHPNNRFSPNITLARFVELAKQIAAAGESAPRTILYSLRTTIKLRKATAAFYSTDEDAWAKNRSYKYAVEMFEEVFSILGGAKLDSLLEQGTLLTGVPSVEEELEDHLKQLTIRGEAKPETNEWLRDIPLAKARGQKDAKDEYSLEDYFFVDEEYGNTGAGKKKAKAGRANELIFAIQWFFQDVNTIRKHCCQLWAKAEPSGTESRIAAAYVTNQAAEMVKQLESEMRKDFPELRSTDDIYGVLRKGKEHLEFEERAAFEYQIMGLVQLRLGDFGRVLVPGHAPLAKDGYFGYYDPHGDRTKMTTEKRNEEDMCVLMNYLPELVAILTLIPDHNSALARPPHLWAGSDALGPEFKRFFENRNHPVSMSLIFSAQMLLEVLYIRRAMGVSDDLEKMRKIHSFMRKEQNTFLAKNDINFDFNMSGFLQQSKDRAKFLEFQLGAEDQLYRYKVIEGWRSMSPRTIQPDSHWRMNPWMCANATAYALLDQWDLGTQLVSGAGFVQSTMHLWNLLTQTGYLDDRVGSGSDLLMNHLIRVFGEAVFMGKPPTTDFSLPYVMMLSPTPEYVAKSHGKKGIVPIVSEMFRLHINQAGLDAQQIRRVQEAHTYGKDVKLAGSVHALNTILQPLEIVKDLVDRELQDMVTLNLWKIHLRCVELFRRLWETLKGDLSKAEKAPEYRLVERESQLPVIAGYIMRTVDKHGVQGNSLLVKAAEVFAECGLDREKVEAFKVGV